MIEYGVDCYTVRDGLQGNQFLANACYQNRSREFYFGGSNGFTVFWPGALRVNDVAPRVAITDFQIFNRSVTVTPLSAEDSENPLKKSITQTTEMVLPHTQNNPGFDDNWNLVGECRLAIYTNLNPGTYTFQVKVTDRNHIIVWSITIKNIFLTVSIRPLKQNPNMKQGPASDFPLSERCLISTADRSGLSVSPAKAQHFY